MENLDTPKEMPIDNLPPLEAVVNFDEDSTIGVFVVVKKNVYEYDDDSFRSFVGSLRTLKGAIFVNQFDIRVSNMIQPLVDQSCNITDKDVENLVTIASIK